MKANAWNVGLETVYRSQFMLSTQLMILNLSLKFQPRNFLPWPIYIINSVDYTELPCYFRICFSSLLNDSIIF